MKYNDFRDFSVWKKAFELVLVIYKITKDFPEDERFGMISDMRRAANSIPHNIAEGYGRFSSKDKNRFYKFARGSAFELQSQLLVAEALGFIQSQNLKDASFDSAADIIKELNYLMKKIEN